MGSNLHMFAWPQIFHHRINWASRKPRNMGAPFDSCDKIGGMQFGILKQHLRGCQGNGCSWLAVNAWTQFLWQREKLTTIKIVKTSHLIFVMKGTLLIHLYDPTKEIWNHFDRAERYIAAALWAKVWKTKNNKILF